jgi:hypothetical protein
MTPVSFVPDHIIEAIADERPVGPPYAPLAGLADDVRALGDGPAPDPSAELALLLRGSGAGAEAGTASFDGDIPPLVALRRRSPWAVKVAGLGIVAKVALGSSIAAAGVAGAGAAGVLPGGAGDVVRSAIEALSPFDLGTGSTDEPRSKPDSHGSTGSTGSTDVTGPDQGSGGTTTVPDGSGDDDRPPDWSSVDDPPGQTGDTGLERANETPAEPHVPDATATSAPRPTPSSTVPPQRPDDPGPETAGETPATGTGGEGTGGRGTAG